MSHKTHPRMIRVWSTSCVLATSKMRSQNVLVLTTELPTGNIPNNICFISPKHSTSVSCQHIISLSFINTLVHMSIISPIPQLIWVSLHQYLSWYEYHFTNTSIDMSIMSSIPQLIWVSFQLYYQSTWAAFQQYTNRYWYHFSNTSMDFFFKLNHHHC